QFGEQGNQIRVSAIVEDQKAGVDGMDMAFELHVDRVRVAAGVRTGFEERHLIVLRKQVGARQARNAGADDRDPVTVWLWVQNGVTHWQVSSLKRAPVKEGFGWICAPMIEIRSRCGIGCRGVVKMGVGFGKRRSWGRCGEKLGSCVS